MYDFLNIWNFVHKIKNYFISSENRSATTHSVYTPLLTQTDREESADTITVERNAETVTETSERNAIIRNRVPFINRVKCGIVQLLLLSYLTVSSFLLKCLCCVLIGEVKVLVIQGNTECYTWWQGIILAIVITWMTPFCISLYVAYSLLQEFKNIFKSSRYLQTNC